MYNPNNSSDILQFRNEDKSRLPKWQTLPDSYRQQAEQVKEFFSVCGTVCTDRRCRLTAANLDRLVFSTVT